mgnify:CR=1 FL=1
MIPGIQDAVEILAIADPTTLVDMMTHSRGDEIVLVGIAARHEKLGHRIAYRCIFDMLAERPPAEIIHLLEVTLRTVEEGHILLHPVPCLRIRNG